MPAEKPDSQVSPELKRLQQPEQNDIRTFLRTVGPLLLVAGVLCIVVGVINFFMAFGGDGPPRLFWLIFLGMPLVFAGSLMSQFGFIGAVARYVAGETAPVATDAINYVADETKESVETVARSAAKGIVEGIAAGKVAVEKNFCPHCGFPAKTDFKFCPKCGKPVATDGNRP